jgi:hypothetical protein
MPRCAESTCGRWRPERLAPRWASGIRFNQAWYCSRECVEQAARSGLDTTAAPAVAVPSAVLPPLKVGALLRHMGAVSSAQLTSALQRQKQTGRKLGAELLNMGIVTSEQILRALASQSSASYLPAFDPSRVAAAPAWLPSGAVAALGLVPFELDELSQTLRVVCAAPVPRAAVRAMVKLTGWAVEPYIVDDQVFTAAMRAYQPAPAAATGTVRTVAAAAARVADAAFADRAVTMRHASFAGRTWVTVAGTAPVADVMVIDGGTPCQAERIAR